MRLLAPWLSLIIAMGGILSACADSPSAPAPTPKRFGWRSAGLVLPDAGVKNGLIRLVNVGNTLFAMQAVEPAGAPVSRPEQWRIWKGSVGSDQWNQIVLPDGEVPNEWVVISQSLIVGAKYSPRVFSYSPGGVWKEIEIIRPSDSTPNRWGIEMLGAYKGQLVAGIYDRESGGSYTWTGDMDAQPGIVIPSVGKRKNIPHDRVNELGTYLFGYQNQLGVYRYRQGDTAWEALPSARGRTDPAEWEYLSALSVVDGKLYVGYAGWSDGVYRWDDGKWTSMTPQDSLKRRETSQTVRVIAAYRGRLFQAGSGGSGIAMLVPRDSGKVQWGDWRLVDSGWCEVSSWCPSETRGIVGVGDTLYAAAWNFIAKVPVAELDSMARPMYKK